MLRSTQRATLPTLTAAALGGLCTLLCTSLWAGSLILGSSASAAAAEASAPRATAEPLAQRGRGGRKVRSSKARDKTGTPMGLAPNRGVKAPAGEGGAGAEDGARGGASNVDTPRTGTRVPGAGTGGGDRHPAEREQKLWFAQADLDSSGWISYREASASLRFDAPNYRAVDKDRDGRLDFAEFNRYVISESNKDRKIKAPIVTPTDTGARRRTPQQLRAAFDNDLDGAISRFEFETILRDYSQEAQALDDQDVFVRLDANGDRKLDIKELDRLASFLYPLGPTRPVLPGANTVLDLFGAVEDMGDAHPPRIVGPVPPFRRLDLDNDGFVDLEDLERLEGRSFNPVRLKSVLNTLDINYDGRLSEGEFLSSMAPPKRK